MIYLDNEYSFTKEDHDLAIMAIEVSLISKQQSPDGISINFSIEESMNAIEQIVKETKELFEKKEAKEAIYNLLNLIQTISCLMACASSRATGKRNATKEEVLETLNSF